jgi:ubiquinone/menaquinone biosynthesis C-methylase UbiE
MTKQGRLFAELEQRQLEFAVKTLRSGDRVLEVGCGTGRFSLYLAQRGFSVVAVDPSPDMLAVAASKCSHLDMVRFEQVEGATLGFDDATFDFVFAIRVLNQAESEEQALQMIREMIRVARRGGLVLAEFVNRERPFAKRSTSVRLSFGQIEQAARECDCDILRHRGVLAFSQTLLNRVPAPVVPLWGWIEKAAAKVFWRWASRGYILLRKRQGKRELR